LNKSSFEEYRSVMSCLSDLPPNTALQRARSASLRSHLDFYDATLRREIVALVYRAGGAWLLQATPLCALLMAGACLRNPVPETSYTPQPVEVTGTGSGADVETAAAGVTRDVTCPDGRLVVSSGSGYRLLVRALRNPPPPPYEVALPNPAPYQLGSWDNQLVHLANGDLLLVRAGSSTTPITPIPSWWNDWFGRTPPSPNRNGLRSAHILWRYSCSDGWSTVVALDAGTVAATDPNGALQMGWCSQGWPGAGGFDRQELYADPAGLDPDDPSRQRVYLSTRCTRFDDDSVAVFTSPDSGVTWQPSTIRLPPWTAVAMTTTPDGRLFMLHCYGSQPTLYWSNDRGGSLATPGGWDISFSDGTTTAPCGTLPSATVGVGQPTVIPVSLARASDETILATYPSAETVTRADGTTYMRQVQKVVWVVPTQVTGAPLVVPLLTVRAATQTGSVLQAAFIEDERSFVGPGPRATVLYWVETDGLPARGPVSMHARYILFQGALRWTAPALLSGPAGWAETRTANQTRGDYMKGGFFFDAKLNFVTAWPETSQVYARIITVEPPPSLVARNPRSMPGARIAPASSVDRAALPPGPCDNCARKPGPLTQ
jgi:hypothetical protein